MTAVPKINPNHVRRVPKRSSITKITKSVRREVLERSEGCCERCGRSSAYAFEMSHLVQASHGGRGDDPANIVLLCGPSVNTGTCHNFADYTAEGRKWRMKKHEELKRYYEQ
ncbi:HNH endonuclease [Oceanobacillus caeni]|uniref:HNH endonuclease n=1 Tax=Oceanobacillus caeni TaxID=405946 RepID=UPI00214A115D|nr:HNH endonuclease signature motif containing protein [Oceanobacillus caeni]MCR1833099.1 HNH endonuclease [Oceanobacillus caeni]